MSVEEQENTAPVRRGEKSRRKLLDAARKLFVERGYHDTRPQDISKEASVGHGTFYLHFRDKRECFNSFVDEAQVELQIGVDKLTENVSGIEERLRAVFHAVITYSNANPGVLTAAMVDPGVIGAPEGNHIPLAQRWVVGWTEAFNRYKENGELDPGLDTGVLGSLIVGQLNAVCLYAQHTGADIDLIIETMTRAFLHGVRPGAGSVGD